ncbi:hypothetical protein C8R46DRAFT_1165174 [Mycena filopes]|nr:hypothetical protein C8R46DRAFT_1165174 [Mycena filopes]
MASTDLQRALTDEKKDTASDHNASLADNIVVVEQDDGVTRIEALYLVFSKGWKIWMLYGSLAIISFVYALSQSTTYTYETFAASSFESHPLIGTIAVVVSIMSGVAKPFIAKIADLSSRPMALVLSVFLYALGYIIVASSTTIGAVAGGTFQHPVHHSPHFLAGNISTGISANTLNGWRWGYGMFIILVPVSITPALVVLFWANRKAKKIGGSSFFSADVLLRVLIALQRCPSPLHLMPVASCLPANNSSHSFKSAFTIGVSWTPSACSFSVRLLLGFGFALILLPFTLYTGAKNGWKNPSLIAMFVVGGLLLMAFAAWEFNGSRSSHYAASCTQQDIRYVTLTYFSSYVYVVKDWSLTNYTYFNNILTVGLCGFSVVGGLIQRYTHRYKWLQLSGLCIRVIGQGLIFLASNGNKSDAVLVMSQILTSMGGAFSVIGSQVATQASVPHQDMALVIALLSLWTSVGGGIGSAIAAAIWNAKLPANLEKYLGDTLNSTEIADIYGSILVARMAEPRELVIKAYDDTAYYLFLPALCLSCLSILAGCLTTNFYLGTTHNAIEAKEVRLRDSSETDEDVIKRKAAEVEARFKDPEKLSA